MSDYVFYVDDQTIVPNNSKKQTDTKPQLTMEDVKSKSGSKKIEQIPSNEQSRKISIKAVGLSIFCYFSVTIFLMCVVSMSLVEILDFQALLTLLIGVPIAFAFEIAILIFICVNSHFQKRTKVISLIICLSLMVIYIVFLMAFLALNAD